MGALTSATLEISVHTLVLYRMVCEHVGLHNWSQISYIDGVISTTHAFDRRSRPWHRQKLITNTIYRRDFNGLVLTR